MLTIKASAKSSQVNGLGLFADEDIPRGTTIWKFNPRFDLVFDPKEVAQMPKTQQELIRRYAYLSATTGKYIYSIDDSRFTNHSSSNNNIDTKIFPNEPETRGIANRDIKKGEELLINYRSFDVNDANSAEEYLKN